MTKRIAALAAAIILLATLLPTGAFSAFDRTTVASDVEWNLLKQINAERVALGRAPLTVPKALYTAAGVRASEVARTGTVHQRPNGTQWYTAMTEAGYAYDVTAIDEISAYPSTSASAVFAAWNVNGSKNRNAMINVGYTHAAVAYSSSAWAVLLTSCEPKNVAIYTASDDGTPHFKANTSLDAQNQLIELTCAHGKSYAPLASNMIDGYKPAQVGYQKITLNYGPTEYKITVYNDFMDVVQGSWYYNSVARAYDNGLFGGTGAGVFSPTVTMTRAMFVTVLGNIDAVDISKYTGSRFSDVPVGKWYSPYVEWAASMGIASGTGEGRFSPDATITRQQICVMMHKFMTVKGYSIPDAAGTVASFKDAASIAAWARESVEYCRAKGFVSGDSAGNFNPNNKATRAEGAVMIMRLFDSIS